MMFRTFQRTVSLVAFATAAWLFSSPAYAPPKPKVAEDVQCATPCVDNSEIQGPIDASKLDSDTLGQLTCEDTDYAQYNSAQQKWECAKAPRSALVVRDNNENEVGRVILPERNSAIVRYQTDPADANYFNDFPFVAFQVEVTRFTGGSVAFQKANCDLTGEIYIDHPKSFWGIPLLYASNDPQFLNDPQVGAVAFVPTTNPPTPIGNAFWNSRLQEDGTCTNISSNGGANLGEAVPLGFVGPYKLAN